MLSIAVITPVHQSHISFLPELSRSLQPMEAVWVVGLDGFREIPSLPRQPDILLRSDREHGAASTRNRCLAYTETEMAAPIDADDLAEPEGIFAAAAEMRSNRDLGACGYASPNFNKSRGDINLGDFGSGQNRTWQPGEIWREYASQPDTPDRRFSPFRANCAVFRADALTEAGGWTAMPVLEDLDMLLKINKTFPVGQTDKTGIWRRIHPQQTTKNIGYFQEKAAWNKILAKKFGTLN